MVKRQQYHEEPMTAFAGLLSGIASAFSDEGRVGGDLAASALRNADPSSYRHIASHVDPSAALAVACQVPDALPLAQHVICALPLIGWTSWEGRGLSRQISQRLYSAELIGPDGHIPSEKVRVGLLFSEADTDYPVSSHSGEETYLVIAGTAEWTVADGEYVPKSPGALIHHPAWIPHGRRCAAEPFLGAWRWSGDLDLTTFSVAGG